MINDIRVVEWSEGRGVHRHWGWTIQVQHSGSKQWVTLNPNIIKQRPKDSVPSASIPKPKKKKT